MSVLSLGIIAGTVVIAYILKSLTGFGTSLILVPILSIFFGIKDAIVIAAFGDVISSGLLLLRDRQHADIRKLKEVGIGVLTGTIIGVSILNMVNATILKHALALFIIIYLAIQQFAPEIHFTNEKARKAAGYVFGLIGGICGGIFNTNGPALVIYMKGVFSSKEFIRANLLTIFLLDSVWRSILLMVNGLVSWQILGTFAAIILPSLILGIYVGNKIDKKLHSNHYTALSKAVLAVSGLKLLLS